MTTMAIKRRDFYTRCILDMRLADNLHSIHAGERIDEFSASRCDCCRTQLAGNRFEAIGLPESKRARNGIGKPIRYSVCLDCFEEIAGIAEY